jgi:hypothetical protein
MIRDPRAALAHELTARQVLLDQLRTLAADDPEFFLDLVEGETPILELLAALDASLAEDERLAEGVKTAVEQLQARRRAAETRRDLKRRLLAHTLQQLGLQSLRLPTATLSLSAAGVKAVVQAPEEVPARWWKPQPPKLDQDGLTKAVRARAQALQAAAALPDLTERAAALAQVETLQPLIPGVTASNGGLTLTRRV